jgi:hypothetical protein
MFITLEEFFNNYRIKNQQQPNETVLNRGIMRLKRETRELKSLLDILVGNEVEAWDINRIYEKDEYVSYSDLVYKSRIDTNLQHTPFREDTTNWEIITINGIGGNGAKIDYKQYTSTPGQTHFVTPFNMETDPMIFVEGILLDSARFTKTSNIDVILNDALMENETVIITSGTSYASDLVLAKDSFVATAGQQNFVCSFEIKSPSVFVDGVLIDQSLYTWANQTLHFITGLTVGKKVTVGNGNIIGSELYTKSAIDTLLAAKRNVLDSYTKTEVNTALSSKADVTYVDTAIAGVNLAKANKATSLAGYGITDAYTTTQVNSALDLKLSTNLFTDAVILQKIKNVDGADSGLNADLLDGLDSSQFLRNDEANEKMFNLDIYTVDDPEATEPNLLNQIILDVESEDPNIFIRKYDIALSTYEESLVYTDKNTSHIMIIKEGYFKGSWEPTLNGTFGIANYADYNWTVSVTPTLTGFEHDFNKDFASGHTIFTGFDNNLTWDENQSEYHYGYIQGAIVKLDSVHRNGSTRIDIPARYHLIGVLKTFSSYAQVNQI